VLDAGKVIKSRVPFRQKADSACRQAPRDARDVFGEDRTSVRRVLGVASLPLGMPVAVEVIMEVEA
jgi:hypothetical protein